MESKKIRSVRNVLVTYLLISIISGRPGIFAAVCASFPFIIPVVFSPDLKREKLLLSSFLCGIPGILVSVLYLLFFGTYSTHIWFVPAVFAFFMCLLYSFIQKRIKPDRLITAKAVITVAVCFFAFI